MKAFSANSFGEVSNEVTFGSHLRGCPIGETTVIHREAIVMLKDGDDILGARVFKKLRPRLGIVVPGFEHWDEVFVAKLCQWTVLFNVVFVDSRAGQVHLSRVPLATKGSDR